MKKLLWLTSWYPNKTNPSTGDFIQRQAIATARIEPLNLIFVTKDLPADQANSKTVPLSASAESNIQEYIRYYPESRSSFGFFFKFHSLRQYVKQHLKIIKQLKDKQEMPEIVHVQVAMKAGLIAMYLNKRYRIPFVITEHWSGYFNEGTDPLKNKGFIFRFFLKKIFQQASFFLPVTKNLGERVNQTIARIPTIVIPNVVDISIFNMADCREPPKFRFIHVSSLLDLKNPQGIVAAFEKLIESGMDAELVIVGPPSISVQQMISQKNHLKDRLYLTGEISYEEVAQELKKASAFILFSWVESLPCVILESLCCGVPVISSRVGGIPEVISGKNGILVDAGDGSQLLDAMKTMITGYSSYEKKTISADAQRLYSYDTVGKQYAEIYRMVLNEK